MYTTYGDTVVSADTLSFTVTGTGIPVFTSQQSFVNIFPNPCIAGNNLKIDLNGISAIKIVVYDLNGKIVDQLPIKAVSDLNFQTDKLKNGVYILSIITKNSVINRELLIQ